MSVSFVVFRRESDEVGLVDERTSVEILLALGGAIGGSANADMGRTSSLISRLVIVVAGAFLLLLD